MKRILVMILTLALLFAGCGGKTTGPDGELSAGQTNSEQAENVLNGKEEKAETGKDSWFSPVMDWFSSLFDSDEGGDSPKEGADAAPVPDRSISTGLLWLDLAVTEEEIFWCEDGRVFRLDPREEGTTEGTLFYEGMYVTKLASDGGKLAVCSPDGQVIMGIPGEEGFEDPADLRLPVPDGCMVSGLVLAGKTVVFLWRSEENGPDRLGYYNLASEDFIEDTPMENSGCLLCPGGGSRIFVFWASRTAVSLSMLYSFDVHAMKRIANFPIPSGQQFNAIGYNPAADRLYALDQSGGISGSFLHVWNPDDPSGSEKIEPHDSIRKSPTKLLFLGGSAVVLKPVDGVISVCGDYLAENGVVTVLVPETNRIIQDSLGHISYVLKRDHGVKLTVKRMKEEVINTKLLAQDDDFDLYFADGRLLNLNYPVWEPLEDFPLIKEKTALLFDDIVRICSVNGHIFGLPYYMQLGNCFLPWNESVARSCGVEKPKPGWTLDDYTELAKKVREKGCYIDWLRPSVHLQDYMWNFFDPFGTGTVNDDGTILRLLIVRCVQDEFDEDGTWGEATGLLWLHDGGFAFGVPEQESLLVDRFCSDGSCVAVLPDYTKSGERPYPAALEDAYRTLLWMKDNAEALGIRPDQLFVGGRGAGGGLTAALCLRARDMRDVRIAFQMPVYPMLDDRMESESARDNNGPVWNSAMNRVAWDLYLRDFKGDEKNGEEGTEVPEIPVYAAPAREKDLTGMPPACSIVGDLEVLRDETVLYFARMKQAGVPVSLRVYHGCFHAFETTVLNCSVALNAQRYLLESFRYAQKHYFAPNDPQEISLAEEIRQA